MPLLEPRLAASQREQFKEFRAAWERENGHRPGRAVAEAESSRLPPAPGKTQFATVLAAAGSLPQPFTLTQLVIAAWELDAPAFGLPGRETDYPSDRRVYLCLVGRRGLVARGRIRKTSRGYFVTP